jgi:hypothetical protein
MRAVAVADDREDDGGEGAAGGGRGTGRRRWGGRITSPSVLELKRATAASERKACANARLGCITSIAMQSYSGFRTASAEEEGGVVSAVQVWNPDDWEVFALSLLQSRHGPLSVHKIPAAHKGDFGIDYYCTTQAVAYQCYAVQEPIDIATRANRQKKKITIDTGKIISNASDVSKLFMGTPIKHWILLTPLHDSKEVNLHCSKKTLEIRGLNCPHLDGHFEVSIHDQQSFPADAVAAGIAAMTTVTLDVPSPTSAEMMHWQVGSPSLLANATHKLMKRAGPHKIQEAVAEAVRSFLQGKPRSRPSR